MKRTRKTQTAGVSRSTSLLPQSIWRRILKLFRHNHDPLLVESLTAFNEPRIYLPSEFGPPMRLVVSQL
jgi:hypothetical protein